MGSSSSKRVYYPSLPPSTHPIGVNEVYTKHANEIKLRVGNRQISSSYPNEFEIKEEENGNKLVFRIPSKQIGWIKDLNGKKLFEICNPLILFDVQNDDNKRILEIDDDFLKTKQIQFQNRLYEDQKEILFVKGDLLQHDARIETESGQTIAHIKPATSKREKKLSEKYGYTLTIAPGVDISFLLALTICLDEKLGPPKPDVKIKSASNVRTSTRHQTEMAVFAGSVANNFNTIGFSSRC